MVALPKMRRQRGRQTKKNAPVLPRPPRDWVSVAQPVEASWVRLRWEDRCREAEFALTPGIAGRTVGVASTPWAGNDPARRESGSEGQPPGRLRSSTCPSIT